MAKPEKYTLKNGETKWKFRVYLGINPKTGKQEYTNRQGFRTKGEANKVLRRIQAKVDEGTYFEEKKDKTNYTFKDVYLIWIDEYKQTVADSTLLKTKGDFERRILPEIGHYKIKEINHTDMQQLANKWGEYKNCRLWISSAGRIFQYARKHHIATDNPTELVTIPKLKKKVEKKRFYEKNELDQLVKELMKEENLQKVALLRLLIFTGIRRGEAIALYWDCVNFLGKTIEVKRSLRRREKTIDDGRIGKTELYIGEPKNESSYRKIPIDDETLDVLKKLRKYQINERVFNGQTGNILPPSKPREWLRKNAKKADIEPINVHGLRHTYASLLVDMGASPKEVQYLLGHSKIETTLKIYTHLTEQSKKDFANKFTAYISGTEQNTEQSDNNESNIVDMTTFN